MSRLPAGTYGTYAGRIGTYKFLLQFATFTRGVPRNVLERTTSGHIFEACHQERHGKRIPDAWERIASGWRPSKSKAEPIRNEYIICTGCSGLAMVVRALQGEPSYGERIASQPGV
jgi:hypothetical protein